MTPQPANTGVFEPKDAIKYTAQCGFAGFTAGLFFAAVENSLRKENVGVSGVWKHARGSISYPAISAAAFGFVDASAANLRGRDDHWNKALGAFVGGGCLGMYLRKISVVLGVGSFMGVSMGVFEYTGGRLTGWKKRDEEEDEFERKLKLRANRRRPIEETIAEIGEGRGIKPPGYEERRRARIKESYGFEIKTVPATSSGE